MSEDTTTFRGEDESAGEASPALDLTAAAILFGIGAFIAVLSLNLPVPGKVISAPGLLPFLVSSSLALMAILLGMSAWRRRVKNIADPSENTGEFARRFQTILAVTVYVSALHSLGWEGFVPVFGRQIPIGSFEPATVIFLCFLLRLFWTERLGPIVSVSIGWTFFLSLAFRGLFGIPLPG